MFESFLFYRSSISSDYIFVLNRLGDRLVFVHNGLTFIERIKVSPNGSEYVSLDGISFFSHLGGYYYENLSW